MVKIFKAAQRRFEENPGRVDGFRLMSDAAITSARAASGGSGSSGAGNSVGGSGSSGAENCEENSAGNGAGGGTKNSAGGNAGGSTKGSVAAKPLGAGSLNFDVRRLDPGEISSLYHFHRHAEELFMVISGSATLRTPDGLHVLRMGDIAFFGTGADGAHQLYNHADEPCVYLDVRTFAGCDIAEYPDSGRLLVVPTMERFDKAASTGYFDGEPDAATLREIFNRK